MIYSGFIQRKLAAEVHEWYVLWVVCRKKGSYACFQLLSEIIE